MELLRKQVWILENNKEEKCVEIKIINCTEVGTGENIQLDPEDELEILRIIIRKEEEKLKGVYEQLKEI